MEEVLVIDDHIWEDTINIVFTDDIKTSIKEQCKSKKLSFKKYDPGDDCNGIVYSIDEKNYRGTWVVFNVKELNPGIIVHEVSHLVLGILSCRCIEHNENTTEVFAYTEQWFFNKIYNFWKEIESKQLNNK